MANNRLYIANKELKTFLFLEKGWGVGFDGGWFDDERVLKFKEFISQAYSNDCLFLFDETSDKYKEVFDNYTKIE